MSAPPPPSLTPAQERTLALLRRADEPVTFSAAFVDEIERAATAAFEQFHERVGTTTLFVNKTRLAEVHGCEGRFMAPDDFQWSPKKARGQVAHKAIELLLNWPGEPTPRELVDEALARLSDQDSHFGRWVAKLGPGDEAELRGHASDRLIKFMESFPPLPKSAFPTTETRARWPVDGPILLGSKADLVIGPPDGRVSRKVIIDLKTGWVNPIHREDLRFYALVETLKIGVPPRKLVTYYLDAARADVEDVTEDVVWAALRRTLDGVHSMIELQIEGRAPELRPGTHCHWCPIRHECPVSAADKSHDEFDEGDG